MICGGKNVNDSLQSVLMVEGEEGEKARSLCGLVVRDLIGQFEQHNARLSQTLSDHVIILIHAFDENNATSTAEDKEFTSHL